MTACYHVGQTPMPSSPATLPEVVTLDQFRAVARDEARLGPGVAALCERHGLGGVAVTRFADGSLPVYALGDSRVLKLYPAPFRRELDVEAPVLAAVHGRLPIPTPGVEATGERDGWGYVLMQRLRGESLAVAWPRIPVRDRERLAGELGEALAALHALRGPALDALDPPDWDELMRAQAASCVERQRAKGATDEWLAQIPAFLAAASLPADGPRVPLHTEVMREHLLVEEDERGWRFSGLFDFEPAMRGAAEYEFASVGVFVSCGDAALLRRLLLAYGYRPADLDEACARRLLAYALLHRYSNLRWYLERLPPLSTPTLAALAAHGWGAG
jgi:hygromycin-B 7''-O-kinase